MPTKILWPEAIVTYENKYDSNFITTIFIIPQLDDDLNVLN